MDHTLPFVPMSLKLWSSLMWLSRIHLGLHTLPRCPSPAVCIPTSSCSLVVYLLLGVGNFVSGILTLC